MNYINSIKENNKIIYDKVNLLYDKLVISDEVSSGYQFPHTPEYNDLTIYIKQCITKLFNLFLQGKNMIKYYLSRTYGGYSITLDGKYIIAFSSSSFEITIIEACNYEEQISTYFTKEEYAFFQEEIEKLFLDRNMNLLKELR